MSDDSSFDLKKSLAEAKRWIEVPTSFPSCVSHRVSVTAQMWPVPMQMCMLRVAPCFRTGGDRRPLPIPRRLPALYTVTLRLLTRRAMGSFRRQLAWAFVHDSRVCRDGKHFCKLVNTLQPGLIQTVNSKMMNDFKVRPRRPSTDIGVLGLPWVSGRSVLGPCKTPCEYLSVISKGDHPLFCLGAGECLLLPRRLPQTRFEQLAGAHNLSRALAHIRTQHTAAACDAELYATSAGGSATCHNTWRTVQRAMRATCRGRCRSSLLPSAHLRRPRCRAVTVVRRRSVARTRLRRSVRDAPCRPHLMGAMRRLAARLALPHVAPHVCVAAPIFFSCLTWRPSSRRAPICAPSP